MNNQLGLNLSTLYNNITNNTEVYQYKVIHKSHITKKPLYFKQLYAKVIDNGSLYRAMYVMIGMAIVLAVYLLIKLFSLRKSKKVKKYGILNSDDFDYDDEWGDNWLKSSSSNHRKSVSKNKKSLTSKKSKSESIKKSEYKPLANGHTHNKNQHSNVITSPPKWEMAPMDKYNPDNPLSDSEDDSDLDLFHAPIPPNKCGVSKSSVFSNSYSKANEASPFKPSPSLSQHNNSQTNVKPLSSPPSYQSTMTTVEFQ